MPKSVRQQAPIRYALLLEAMRSDVPAARRLALALKILKRTCEFRCVEVIEVTTSEVNHGGEKCSGGGPDQSR